MLKKHIRKSEDPWEANQHLRRSAFEDRLPPSRMAGHPADSSLMTLCQMNGQQIISSEFEVRSSEWSMI